MSISEMSGNESDKELLKAQAEAKRLYFEIEGLADLPPEVRQALLLQLAAAAKDPNLPSVQDVNMAAYKAQTDASAKGADKVMEIGREAMKVVASIAAGISGGSVASIAALGLMPTELPNKGKDSGVSLDELKRFHRDRDPQSNA